MEKSGGKGDDVIIGTDDKDTLSGGGGDDTIKGLQQRDRIHGDSGGDEIYGDDGDDNMFGDGSADFINAADERGGEQVNCGAGTQDRAIIDSKASSGTDNRDFAKNCETVFVAVARDADGQSAGDLGPTDVQGALDTGLIE